MPVKLEHLTTPADADWLDLEKIIAETAPTGLNPGAAAAGTDLRQWLSDDRWIMGARFNDRIIGAVLAERQGSVVTLSAAGVRKITQRRGVMHQLLHFIQRWAGEQNLTLQVNMNDCGLRAPLCSRGFSGDDDRLQYQPG